jgi:hypothetical protein
LDGVITGTTQIKELGDNDFVEQGFTWSQLAKDNFAYHLVLPLTPDL